jgi:hypothetical protein
MSAPPTEAHRRDDREELERFKREVNLSEFAAARGYRTLLGSVRERHTSERPLGQSPVPSLLSRMLSFRRSSLGRRVSLLGKSCCQPVVRRIGFGRIEPVRNGVRRQSRTL